MSRYGYFIFGLLAGLIIAVIIESCHVRQAMPIMMIKSDCSQESFL